MRQLKKYSDNRFKKLLTELDKYQTGSDQEALHQVRVDLKKIRAVFHLIGYCSDDFYDVREYSPLKKIFDEAGKIRENFVANKLLSDYKIKGLVKEINTGKELDHISGFRENITEFKKIIVAAHNVLIPFFEKVNIDCLNRYLILLQRRFKKNVFPGLDEIKLHKSRKIIKEIMYISGIFKKEGEIINPHYDQIQELIGAWHDKKVLIELLKANNPVTFKRTIMMLETGCRADIMKLKLVLTDFFKKEVVSA